MKYIFLICLFLWPALSKAQVVLPAYQGTHYNDGITDCGTVADSDGNVYQTVVIGDQCWMAENLKYLPSVVGPGTGSETIPYYYVYGYNGTDVTAAKATANYDTYGVLYNWTAAMDGSASSEANPSGVQGVCPDGWHLPSDAEWTALEDYLIANGYNWDGSTTGDKTGKSLAAKSGWTYSSTTGSVGNDQQSNNSTGFTVLPCGYRHYTGYFHNIGIYTHLWSTTEYSTINARFRSMHYSREDLYKSGCSKTYGFSVRCVKD